MNKLTHEQKESNKFKKKIDAILKRTNLKSCRISQVLSMTNSSYRSAASHGKIREHHYDKVVAYFHFYDESMYNLNKKLKENNIFVGY